MPGAACTCILCSAQGCAPVGQPPRANCLVGSLQGWRERESVGGGGTGGLLPRLLLLCFSLSCLAVGVLLSVFCILLLRGHFFSRFELKV